jgi:SAM-dependent methyltransferase
MNSLLFDTLSAERFAKSSPHVSQPALRNLYRREAHSAYDAALLRTSLPKVLDLGAGDGFSCLPFLEKGASVTAVDDSAEQLRRLGQLDLGKGSLLIRQQSVEDFLSQNQQQFDIVLASSFLHHVPDYLALITSTARILTPRGQIFLFQDPIRYASLNPFVRAFDILSYGVWRMSQPDFLGGVARRVRRLRGIYLDDCPQDNIEYHCTREGVDQDAIEALLVALDFRVKTIRYWSQPHRFFQRAGECLRLENTFGILARKLR